MRAPLSVVISGDTVAPVHIGSRADDITIGSTSPGGAASVTLTLREPILSEFLDGYTVVDVYDSMSAEWVGGGRLSDPGKSSDGSGEVWQITAIGEGPASMTDNTKPRMYVTNNPSSFFARSRFGVAGDAQVGATPDVGVTSDAAVVLSAPGGSVVVNGIVAAMHNDQLSDTGQQLGGYGFFRISGSASASWQNETVVFGNDGTPAVTTITSLNWNAVAAAITTRVVNTNFTAGADVLRLQIRRSGGALTVVDDITWGAFYDLFLVARRMDKTGAYVTDADHATSYVLASEVVADLLGSGMLPRLDTANATIDTTSHHFDELSWLDGITPGGIIEELLTAESAYTWHVWERDLTTGLYSFEFVAWPTTIRYSAGVVDGFTSPAPTSDVYDSVNVRYLDLRGRVRVVTRTQTVSDLITPRSAFIDISDEMGSLANAQRVGDRFLADHAAPPNGGSLRVARPIQDVVNGRAVEPWMIRPGNLVRVRGVRPYVDSLNASDRDGVTVFRIVSVSYNDGDGAATLELDTYSPTEARLIERLTNQRRRKN